MRDLVLLRLDGPLDEALVDPVVVLALDGWTDAGRAGSIAAEVLQEQWHGRRIGAFDADRLYDYRDRRPVLTIDRGLLGTPVWPTLEVSQLTAPGGTPLLLLHGGEPDFAWRTLGSDVVALAAMLVSKRYVGRGSVPAPVPHTRATTVVTTGSDEAVLDRVGRPHERLTVPASCQVVLESMLRDAGLETLGLWARIPHYVAGDYPSGSHALLSTLARELDEDLDLRDLSGEADAHRHRLDEAAAGSSDVQAHIERLEVAYDDEMSGHPVTGPLPTGDEIAAELQRFLREERGEDPDTPDGRSER
jgi:hypothetical protein